MDQTQSQVLKMFSLRLIELEVVHESANANQVYLSTATAAAVRERGKQTVRKEISLPQLGMNFI